LDSPFPIALYWGPEYILIYNTAWSPIAGDKHPWALGRPGREVWPEIWDIIGPEFDAVLTRGEGIWSEDRLLPMRRHGYTEECYFNYSMSPIHGEDGAVVGVFNAVVETTYRVLSERRMGLLRELAQRTAMARSVATACIIAAEVLGNDQADVPFCLVYLLKKTDAGNVARLTGSAGLAAGHPAASTLIDLDNQVTPAHSWPLAQVLGTRQVELVNDLSSRFDAQLPGGPWQEKARSALVAPLLATVRSDQPVGFLIIGVSSHRAADESYRSFAELAAGGLSAAMSSGRAYDDERRKAEALARLDRVKTTFFSNISHELRTPLTLMLLPVEEMLARPDGPTAADHGLLTTVQRNGVRLLKLVNTLLDFSRIEAEHAQPNREWVDLAEFTAELAGTFAIVCTRAGLSLNIDCPTLGEPVRMDRDMWEKIVLNLVSNAFKFTLTGHISVRLQRTADDQRVVLSVSDSGMGIPDAELPHIFDRFHRIDGVRGRSHEGTGIGLALVHDLAQLLDGRVDVQSKLGAGSCFTVEVPIGNDPSGLIRTPEQREASSTTKRAAAFVEEALGWLSHQTADADEPRAVVPGEPRALDADGQSTARGEVSQLPRILLAEDNADMREAIKKLLAPLYLVTAVPDGQAALAVLQSADPAPNLVLTDVMMPRIDGIQLLRHLRASPKTRAIPVVILSARGGEEAMLAGLEADADDYVVKPFSSRELLARVRRTIEMARVRHDVVEAMNLAERMRSKAERHELLQRLVTVQEQESARIARELHDQMGQDVTGLLLGLKRLEGMLANEESVTQLRWLQSLAGQIGRNLHRKAWELRPTSLDDMGLLRALEAYIGDWSERYGIQVDLHAGIAGHGRFSPEVETAVYRVVQEAMTNVLKHAAASTVSLVLEGHGNGLQVIIEDDGKGFDPEAAANCGRIGLAGMRERLALVGGTMTIDSTIGGGTTLYFRIPDAAKITGKGTE
jgi:signal transduction histidine kinase